MHTQRTTSGSSLAETDPMRLFYKDMDRHPDLSPAEEQALGRRIENALRMAWIWLQFLAAVPGDLTNPEAPETQLAVNSRVLFGDAMRTRDASTKKLISSHLRFVIKLAGGYKNSGLEWWELVQAGCEGLSIAANIWDYRRGTPLVSFSAWYIRGAMIDAILANETIRRPDEVIKLARQTHDVAMDLKARGLPLTDENIAAGLEISVKRYRQVIDGTFSMVSLDAPVHEDSDLTIGEVTEDVPENRPDQLVMRMQITREIRRGVAGLPQKDRLVLILRNGMFGQPEHTLQQVGRRFDVTSREASRQWQEAAFRKMAELCGPRLEAVMGKKLPSKELDTSEVPPLQDAEAWLSEVTGDELTTALVRHWAKARKKPAAGIGCSSAELEKRFGGLTAEERYVVALTLGLKGRQAVKSAVLAACLRKSRTAVSHSFVRSQDKLVAAA